MNFHATEASYVTAVVKGLEAFGEMWTFVVGLVNSSQMVNLAVSAGVYWRVVPLVTYVVHWRVVPLVTYVVHYVAIPASKTNLKSNKELDAKFYNEESVNDSNSETDVVLVDETQTEKETEIWV